MNFSKTGQEKGDLLIQVTAWAGLTVLTTYRHLSRWGSIYFSTTCVSSFFFITSFNSWAPNILAKPVNIKLGEEFIDQSMLLKQKVFVVNGRPL